MVSELSDICRQDDVTALAAHVAKHGASSKDQNKWTLLHLAAHYDAIHCAKFLLDLEPDLAKETSVLGDTPLMRALTHKPSVAMVQLLLPYSENTANRNS